MNIYAMESKEIYQDVRYLNPVNSTLEFKFSIDTNCSTGNNDRAIEEY